MRMPNPAGSNRHLAALMRRYLWTAGVVALLAIIIGLLEGMGVSLLIPLLSVINGASPGTQSGGIVSVIQHFADRYNPNTRLFWIISIILAFVLLKAGFQIAANIFAAWVDGRIGQDVRCGMSKRLQDLGYPFFLLEKPSRLVNIVTTDSWRTSEAVRVLLQRIAAGAAAMVFGVVLFLVNWRLSVVVVVGGLGGRLVQKRFSAALRVLSRRTVAANEVLVHRMLFAISGARLIRLFGEQAEEHERFEAASENVRRAILRGERTSGIQGPVLEGVHGILFLIVLIIAVSSRVPLPVLVAFLVLMNRLQPHLRVLEQTGATFASAAGHFDEVEWLLDPTGKPAPPSGDLAFTGLRQGIEFDNTTFDYGLRGEPALNQASFVLRRGRSTALIGPSGAGKSTVINLLCRLLEPTSGTIRVDGQPLSRIRVSDWLSRIAIAGQDVDLIDGTIAENIMYGRGSIDPETMELAVRSAQADFIFDLPLGLNTVVGPRGVSLSGGQRQRISIARALARNPEILILDEATNAVDQVTENELSNIFQALSKRITIVVISHRANTLAFCDDAVVLERGNVVEAGPISSTAAFRAMQVGGAQPGLGDTSAVRMPSTF
jgi:ATP-binding cassette, subfamily B, bacterial MsbA